MTRTTALYFFKPASPEVQFRSRPLVEVGAQFVDGGEPHHAFGHLCLDRAVGVQRIGHSIDDAGFEHRDRRLSLAWRRRRIAIRRRRGSVRFGKRRGRPAAAPQRRIGRPRAFRSRPGVVERRRWHLARFGRRRRGGDAGPGERRSAADGSVVRAWARSRSLRDEEENSRLRRGLRVGAASTGSDADGTSPRTRSRELASSCHGGGDAACAAGSGSTLPAFSAAGCSVACESTATPAPSSRAIFFSSRTTVQMPSRIIPVHAVIAPARIRVLPKLRSSWTPKPTVRRPASTRPSPAINRTTLIEFTPGPRQKCPQAPHATIPSYCAQRQPTIAGEVPREGPHVNGSAPQFRRRAVWACRDFHLVTIAALHQGNYATIPNYLEGELRYMDAGEEAQSAKAGPKGTPGYQ